LASSSNRGIREFVNLCGAEWMLVLAGALLGVWAALRLNGESRLDRLLAVLTPMGAVVVLIRLFEVIAGGPTLDFNGFRLAPAIALARGYNIFPGPDEGPLLDFMYGPMFPVAYTPAALAGSPTGAIWIGILLSFLFAVIPLAWLAFTDSEQRSRLLAASAVVCFGLLCVYDEALYWVALTIHADAPALAFAGCACACLQSRRGDPTNRQTGFSALFAVLAVWSKQVAAPIVVALPLYAWLRDGRRTAFRFALWMTAIGALVSLIFLLWFGFEGIFFNMFQVPGGHPWEGTLQGGSRFDAVLGSLGELAAFSSLSGITVLALAVASYGRGFSARKWLREQPWTCLAWVALLMVPTATLGGAKVGGYVNAYAFSTYFLTGAAVLGLAQVASTKRPLARGAAQLTLAGIIVLSLGHELASAERCSIFHASITQLSEWRKNPQEQATTFARAHPGEVHFIGNPLIGLYSDGKLYSSIYGKFDRALAGFAPGPELMLAHSPPRLRYVALRRDALFPRLRLPEYKNFSKVVPLSDLPQYTVWEGP